MTLKLIIEIASAALILWGFELFNRQSIRGFYVMGVGQFFATLICAYAALWFLAFMHFVNVLMQIRGWMKWKNSVIVY